MYYIDINGSMTCSRRENSARTGVGENTAHAFITGKKAKRRTWRPRPGESRPPICEPRAKMVPRARPLLRPKPCPGRRRSPFTLHLPT